METNRETLDRLLTDTSVATVFELVEDKNNPGVYVGRGPFAKVGVPTSNGRLYTRPVMEREIEKLRPLMESRKLFGELDHPGDGKTKLQRVSHLITNLEIQEDGVVMGTLEVLPTSNGKELEALLGSRCAIDVSSRGFGSVKKTDKKMENGREIQVVGEDFVLKTFDAVAEGAAGNFAQPTYKKEDADDNAEPTIVKTDGSQSSEPAKVDDSPISKPVDVKPDGEAQLLLSMLEEEKDKNKKLSRKIDDLVHENEELSESLEKISKAAKKAAYELCTERALRDVQPEIREEVLELVGNVMNYESVKDLEQQLDKVKTKILDYKSTKIVENKASQPVKIEKKVVAEEKTDKVDKLRSKLEARLKEKEDRDADAFNEENNLDYENEIEESNNGPVLVKDELEYLDNLDLQDYASALAEKLNIEDRAFKKIENKLIGEAVTTEEEIVAIFEEFLESKKKLDGSNSNPVGKKDDAHRSGLFDDVVKGKERLTKGGKVLSEDKKEVAEYLNEDTFTKHRSSSHHDTGSSIFGVDMNELVRISKSAQEKITNNNK